MTNSSKRVYFTLRLRPHVTDPLSSDGVSRFGRRPHRKADKSLFDQLLKLESRSRAQVSGETPADRARHILFSVPSQKTSNAENLSRYVE
jgi:hypothetical protein